MILYRTSNQKRRKSLSFLTTQGQQAALLEQLEKKSWIDEIFNRPLPISVQYATRFGPPGFTKNVFYASEKRETTFFELSYGLLKFQSLMGRGVSAVCFQIQFHEKQKPIDVKNAKNSKMILDSKNYLAAHAWLTTLNPEPESIRYLSVRDPSGSGMNFAIYEPSTILATHAEVEDFILTPQSNGTVDIESLILGKLPSIYPLQ